MNNERICKFVMIGTLERLNSPMLSPGSQKCTISLLHGMKVKQSYKVTNGRPVPHCYTRLLYTETQEEIQCCLEIAANRRCQRKGEQQ